MWIVIGVLAVVVLLVLGGILFMQRRRSRELREQFGPEYERATARIGGRNAERELAERRARVAKLEIVPLSERDARELSLRWRDVQARFVDSPSSAISEADTLVTTAMQKRGYPMVDFEQRVADISVDHASTVANYRQARAIAVRNASGDASTEDLRQGLVHYRALFDELLDETAPAEEEHTNQAPTRRRRSAR
jgi:hypothetical protein